MDIRLPGIDGIEALRQLRAEQTTRGIPIMAMTASVMRLKALRERRGFTQEQLSEKSGVGRSHLARLETGKAGPDAQHAGKVGEGARGESGELAGVKTSRAACIRVGGGDGVGRRASHRARARLAPVELAEQRDRRWRGLK